MNYENQSTQSLETLFKTSIEDGLTTTQARENRSKYGSHDVAIPKTKWFTLLLRQIRSPLIYLLIGSATLSFILGDIPNGSIILTILLANSLLGFFQEYKSEKTARLLMEYLTIEAHVKRDGKIISIDSKELVPGDVAIINPGEAVPADMRIVESTNLALDESILSGESSPQNKNTTDPKNNIAYMGSSVSSGSGIGIVFATGMYTKFGHISKLTLMAPHESQFQKSLFLLSRFLLVLTVVAMIIILGAHLLIKGHDVSIFTLISFCVALAITITPEALPVVTTSALTQGAYKLAQKKVIIRRLSSIEDLGSITLLCTDKTGTITENKLTVTDIYPTDTCDPLLFMAISQKTSQGSFEYAALSALSPAQKDALKSISIITETPFDPIHRKTTKVIKMGDEYMLVSRGAVEEICAPCLDLPKEKIDELKKWENEKGSQGKRVIALALKKIKESTKDISAEDSNLTFAGMVAFDDPIKKTASHAILEAQALGIKIKILTGDSASVAGAVASQIGLIKKPSEVITGYDLAKMNQQEKIDSYKKYTVFARVSPDQKYAIIEELKKEDTVGFLGDGINDAPALKIADVGIVVNKAAEIARSAADVILLKKSLSTIIDGIYLGRVVFANTIKYIQITLASNIGNAISILAASFLLKDLPMLPIQILLVDLLSDGPMIAISSDRVDPEELKHPVNYKIKDLAATTIIFGLVSSVFDFLIFAIFRNTAPIVLHTAWYLESFLTELILIISLRTKRFIVQATAPSKPLIGFGILFASIGIIIPLTSIGQRFFGFETPNGTTLLLVATIAIGYLIATEFTKFLYFRKSS